MASDNPPKFYREGIKIDRGALPEVGDEQYRWPLSNDVDIAGGTTTTIVDVYTVATGYKLEVFGLTVSSNDGSTINSFLLLRKSGATYYEIGSSYFKLSGSLAMTVPYQIVAGESLAVSITNNHATDSKNFMYSINGFLHRQR